MPVHAHDVRPAESADLPAVREVAQQAFAPYVQRIGRRPAPMDADHAAAAGAGRLWVTTLDGVVVGYLRVRVAPTHLQVEDVAVAPAAQGAGAGRRLLALADTLAREAGVPELRLSTNVQMTENLALYPRLGWTRTHRTHEDGYDRVFFRKGVADDSGHR